MCQAPTDSRTGTKAQTIPVPTLKNNCCCLVLCKKLLIKKKTEKLIESINWSFNKHLESEIQHGCTIK